MVCDIRRCCGEMLGNVVDRPTPKPPARLIGDVGRKPALQCTALQSLAGFVAAASTVVAALVHVARRVTLGRLSA